jgi:hypothetical protein
MKKVILTKVPFPYADSVRLEMDGSSYNIILTNSKFNFLVLMKNVIFFQFLMNELYAEDGCIEVIDISHEYRRYNVEDLQSYDLSESLMAGFPAMNFVDLYGNISLKVVCETVEMTSIQETEAIKSDS